MSIAIDAAALLIIALSAWSCAKKGFVRTVVQIVIYILVVLAAAVLSRALAPVIYDKLLEPMMFGKPGTASQEKPGALLVNAPVLDSGGKGLGVIELGVVDLSGIDFSAFGLDLDFSGVDLHAVDLGSIDLSGLDPAGLNLDNLNLEALARGDWSWDALPEPVRMQLTSKLSARVIRPVAVSALGTLCFVAIFTVGSFAARMLLRVLGVINHLPILGGINSVLGAALGIIQGALLVWVLALLLQGLLQLYAQGIGGIDKQALEGTFLVSRFLSLTGG